MISPDVLATAILFAMFGLLTRIYNGSSSWRSYVGLGALVGLVYLAKAPLFPVGLVILVCSVFGTRPWTVGARGGLCAALATSAIAGPWIVAISTKYGHLTVSEIPRIQLIWMKERTVVSSILLSQLDPDLGRMEIAASSPVQVLRIYDYSQRPWGTYPPWTDPVAFTDAYIQRHTKQAADPMAGKGDWKTLQDHFGRIASNISKVPTLFVGHLRGGALALLLTLIGFSIILRQSVLFKGFSASAFLWIPAFAGLGLFSLVWLELRYVSAFVVVLFLWSFALVPLPAFPGANPLLWTSIGSLGCFYFVKSPYLVFIWCCVFPSVFVALSLRGWARVAVSLTAVVLGMGLSWSLSSAPNNAESPPDPNDPSTMQTGLAEQRLARSLHDRGIGEGDRVAVIACPRALIGFRWARLAHVQVIAEIPIADARVFWQLGPQGKEEVLGKLRDLGASAVVAYYGPETTNDDRWQKHGGTCFSIVFGH